MLLHSQPAYFSLTLKSHLIDYQSDLILMFLILSLSFFQEKVIAINKARFNEEIYIKLILCLIMYSSQY